ncbi:MAG TPA: CHRD domain-containing protein [Longimicrobiaceae bacterium]|nr:CHRD domain-containing protein [Longimicrobiaceae bacterium]
MKRSRLWMLALAPLALTACGGGEADAEADREAVLKDTSAVTVSPVEGAAPADPGMAMGGENTVQLNPVGNSGVSGQAMLSDMNGQTQVRVTLTGAKGTHQGHIHQGTCDSPGPPVAPLEPVDATGGSSSTATVQVPMSTVMNGQHIIAYHEVGGNPGATIVCGSIPQHSM